jgi:hypothetical protein
MIAVRRPLPETSEPWPAALAVVAVLCVVWLLGHAIADDALHGVILLGVAIVAVSVARKTLSDWRSGVYLLLTWLLFEDLIRKYIGNNMYVYFAKDALVGVTYVSMFSARMHARDTERFDPPFKFSLGMFFLLGLAQVFNANSPSLWYSLLGLKLDFYYLPLMFVGYALLRRERDLHRFLVVNMGLAAVIALVGIMQTIVGLDFLNPHSGADIEYLSHLVRVSPSGQFVSRPPSVFVSDGRFARYMIIALILALGTAGYLLLRSGRGRKLVFLALALVSVGAVVSGSRSAFVFVSASLVVLSAGMLWGAPSKLGEAYRLVKATRRSLIAMVLAGACMGVFFPSVIGARLAFYRETIMLDSPDSETAARAWDYPVGQLLQAFHDPRWVTGNGIGTTSLGAQYVRRIMGAPVTSGSVVESGYGTLVSELGVLGLVLWLAWTMSLMYHASKVVVKLKGTWAFPVAISILWFMFLLLFPFTYGTFVPYQDFVVNAYFWLSVGILFRLPTLVRGDRLAAINPAI